MDLIDFEKRVRRTAELADDITVNCDGCGEETTVAVELWQQWTPSQKSSYRCPKCTEKYLVGEWRISMMGLRVPMVYRDVPEDLALPEPLRDWRGDPWSVTLLGRTGSGKSWMGTNLFTHAAREMVRETLNSSIYTTAIWTDSLLAGHEMKRDIDDGKRQRYINKLLAAPILMLDDFGAEREESAWVRSELAFVLSHRYNNVLPTIVTTNAEKLSQLVEVDPRSASRLSAGIVIEMPKRDYRMGVKK